MKNVLTKIQLFTIALFGAAITPTYAANFYLGASYGASDSTFDTETLVASKGRSFVSVESSNALRIFGGVNLSPNLALEIGYVDFGDSSATTVTPPTYFYKASVSAVDMAAIGVLPLNPKFNLDARLGVVFWNSDSTFCDNRPCFSESFTGTSPLVGIGGAFHFTKAFALRADWMYYAIDKSEAGAGEWSTLTLGAVVSF